MYMGSLYAFHLFYYVVFAATTFLPKYFGELGMTDGQIGMLMSLPAIAGVIFQPYFGMLSDRVRYKKYVLIGLLFALVAVCIWMDTVSTFALMMLGLCIFHVLQLPIAPVFATISVEYTHEIGRSYGPIRLLGTVGYQLGALVIGVILASSLQGIFRVLAVVVCISGACACFLPPVAGHQHGQQKVNTRALFADRHLMLLFAMVFIGAITSQFYMAFFSKHLGDLGVDNTLTGVMLVLSVALEIPFLIFADKLSRKTSIWNWLLIGFLLNAIRWIGLALSKAVWLLLIFQIPGVSIMACFEFFPVLYVNQRVPEALKGSAQTMLTIITFGLAKIVGSLAGGFISERVGIPAVFACNGAMLLVAFAAFYRPTRGVAEKEKAGG